jgi:hypothetical protein
LLFVITMLLQLAEWPPSGRKMALSMVALDLIQVTPVVASNDGKLAWLPSFAYMAAAFAGLLVGTLPTIFPWPRLAKASCACGRSTQCARSLSALRCCSRASRATPLRACPC